MKNQESKGLGDTIAKITHFFKIDVLVEPGKHFTEEAINRQLNDKERVYAALESDHLKKLVNKGIKNEDEILEIFSEPN